MDGVHVALVSIEGLCALMPCGPATWLSATERSRLDTFTAPNRRRQFLAGRWLARQCLAQWCGGVWQDYALSARDDEPPLVQARPAWMDDRPICMSLSHSADWLACALASHPVGVDVEDTTRPRDTDALANMVLGASELAHQATMGPAERREQFFCRWTLKEAWIKQASNAQAMASIEFEPCLEEEARAVVMTSAGFALAVTPARPDALRLHGAALQGTVMAAWRCCPDR